MVRAAFRARRCVVPASGFYESTGEKGDETPHLFTAADGSSILAFAGLRERWTDPGSGDEVLSGANDWMAPYHDYMPVLLDAAAFNRRLDESLGPEALRNLVVTSRVDHTGLGDDDPTIVGPVAEAG